MRATPRRPDARQKTRQRSRPVVGVSKRPSRGRPLSSIRRTPGSEPDAGQPREAFRLGVEAFVQTFQYSPNLMAISTIEDGRVLDVNDGVLKTLGYRRDEVIGQTTRKLGFYKNYRDRQAMLRKLQKEAVSAIWI